MSWLLSSIVGQSKPALPYSLGAAFADAWGGWQHCRGAAKDDPAAEVSVFKLTAGVSDPKLAAGRNGVKRLRAVRRAATAAAVGADAAAQLRHPLLLQFKDSVEVVDDKAGTVTLFLVTEPVQPLSLVLADLGLEGVQRRAGRGGRRRPNLLLLMPWPGTSTSRSACCRWRRRCRF